MNREQFEKVMSSVDEKYVAEAAEYKKPAARRGRILRIGSLAACAVLVMVGAIGMLSGGGKSANAYRTEFNTGGSYYYSGAPGQAYPADLSEKDGADFTENKSLSPEAEAPIGVGDNSEVITEQNVPGDQSKIIYSAKLTLESKEFDKSFEAIEKIVADLGGYFEDQSVYDQGGSIRKASMTIRVPKDQYQAALEQLKSVTHVTFSNQSAQNVSKEYYDIQSRLDTAKIKLERLQELLKEASDMADIIELENAISGVEWEIDSYSGRLKEFDQQIDYSTITLQLDEVLELTDTEPEPVSFGARLKNAFVYGFENIGDSLVTFVEWFVGNIVWIALIAAAIIIAVKVIKKSRRAL